MRSVLLGCAVVLVVGAGVAEYARRTEFSWARPAEAVDEPRAGAAERAVPQAGRDDFALLELALDTPPDPYVPCAFVVDVREPSGATTSGVTEPSQNGVGLYGPLAPGAEVHVAVVAGGARFGFDADGEVIGEATATIPAQGGRQFLVVPTRQPRVASAPTLVMVRDEDGWPVPGARLTDSESGVTIEATEHGALSVDKAAAPRTFELTPPPGRPDLGTEHWTPDPSFPGGSIKMTVQHRRDVTFGELAADLAAGPIDRVWLRATDARAWTKFWNVRPGARLELVPFGRYVADWSAGGGRRHGSLVVGAEAVRFEPSPDSTPSADVLVTGVLCPDAADDLILVERSRGSCLLPSAVLWAGSWESMAGCGVTSWCAFADSNEDGTPRFRNVPSGQYEIRARDNPRLVARCFEVPPSARGPLRIAAAFQPRASRLHGVVRGPAQKKSWIVEARIFGESSVTQRVHVGESYEFADLPPGIYSVWVTREDWGSQPLRGEPLPQSPWKNVVVDGRADVRLDFDVK
jgi:hypothetical protein